MRLKWGIKLLTDVMRMSVVNKAYGMGIAMIGLLLLGLLLSAAQVSAPFIYTLF